MIQPKEIELLLAEKHEHRKINDDLGFTGEWGLSIKDIIDIFIDAGVVDTDGKHKDEDCSAKPETITTEQITTAAHEAYEKLPSGHVAREGFGQISFLEGFSAGVKWREAEKECITASEQAKSLLVQWAKNMGYNTKSGNLADIINSLR